MKIRRMLVTGAGGMVGRYVPEVFSETELVLTDHAQGHALLDVRDSAAVFEAVRLAKPDAVLHLAAATDVDRCEQDPSWAHTANDAGTHHVALACRQSGAKLVYASTGAVFWGDKKEPYTEEDVPRPRSAYGQSKWAGEQWVTQELTDALIVRAGWMFGGAEKDKKFVGKIVRMLLEGKTSIQAVDDKWGTPTYAKDFLRGIRVLLEMDRVGLYHLGNSGCCTRYEVALALREILKQFQMRVFAVSSDHFPLPAPRGRQEGLVNLRLEQEGLPSMRPWRTALEEYVLTELMAVTR